MSHVRRGEREGEAGQDAMDSDPADRADSSGEGSGVFQRHMVSMRSVESWGLWFSQPRAGALERGALGLRVLTATASSWCASASSSSINNSTSLSTISLTSINFIWMSVSTSSSPAKSERLRDLKIENQGGEESGREGGGWV